MFKYSISFAVSLNKGVSNPIGKNVQIDYSIYSQDDTLSFKSHREECSNENPSLFGKDEK